MPTYTVLGGTGSTGSAVLRALINNPPDKLTLKIYVRSEKKLLGLVSSLVDRLDPIIIQGSFDDSSTLSKCLEGSDVIFSCVALNASEPGMTIAHDTAASIISTLQHLRSENRDTYKTPTVLVLSSASVNTKFTGGPPPPIMAIVETALYYHYADLRQAEYLYRDVEASDPGLLNAIFVQPPGILPGEVPTGYEFSTVKSSGTVSFADLGVAMVELAQERRREEFRGMGVTVLATGQVKQDWWPNVKTLSMGLFAYFLPSLWELGRRWSWW